MFSEIFIWLIFFMISNIAVIWFQVFLSNTNKLYGFKYEILMGF